MRLHTENSSVRFIAISLLVFLAVSFVGYWYWSPYYAADQIKNAVESGDTTKMSKFIDFPKVRLNIQRQINNQIDIKLQEFQQMPVSSHNQIDLYSFQLVDRLVRDLITEEGIAALISGKNKLSKYASHEDLLPVLYFLCSLSGGRIFLLARHKRSFAVWRLISELVCTRS